MNLHPSTALRVRPTPFSYLPAVFFSGTLIQSGRSTSSPSVVPRYILIDTIMFVFALVSLPPVSRQLSPVHSHPALFLFTTATTSSVDSSPFRAAAEAAGQRRRWPRTVTVAGIDQAFPPLYIDTAQPAAQTEDLSTQPSTLSRRQRTGKEGRPKQRLSINRVCLIRDEMDRDRAGKDWVRCSRCMETSHSGGQTDGRTDCRKREGVVSGSVMRVMVRQCNERQTRRG